MWGTAELACGVSAAAIITAVTCTTHSGSLVYVVVDSLQHREFASLARRAHCCTYTQAVGMIKVVLYLQLGRTLSGVHPAGRASAVESTQMWVVDHLALV